MIAEVAKQRASIFCHLLQWNLANTISPHNFLAIEMKCLKQKKEAHNMGFL